MRDQGQVLLVVQIVIITGAPSYCHLLTTRSADAQRYNSSQAISAAHLTSIEVTPKKIKSAVLTTVQKETSMKTLVLTTWFIAECCACSRDC